jgi:hypothetical protein
MSVNYEYPDKTTEPNMDQIKTDIDASAMENKNMENIVWHKRQEITRFGIAKYKPDQEWSPPAPYDDTLVVTWDVELSGGDKTILDGIVADNS